MEPSLTRIRWWLTCVAWRRRERDGRRKAAVNTLITSSIATGIQEP
jgi:hypothetical protein